MSRAARRKIVLGTRGSELALAQARMAEAALIAAAPEFEIESKIIRTRGDEQLAPVDRRAGRKGLFTSEIEGALERGEIDVAVHSAKDLPSELPANLQIRAALPRAGVADVLISKKSGGIDSLGQGATIATGSIRRKFQWHCMRPDLEIVDLRGNVPTRLRKLGENEKWSAIVLARAGLDRLAFDLAAVNFFAAELPLDHFLPAGGQGVIALQSRRDDLADNDLLDRINHRETHLCLRAEREFLRLLHGDCESPVGVFAQLVAGKMKITAQVFEQDRREPRCGSVVGSAENPEELAARLIEEIDVG